MSEEVVTLTGRERVAQRAEQLAWWCVLAVAVLVPLLTTNPTILGIGSQPFTVDQVELPRAIALALLAWVGLGAWALGQLAHPTPVRWRRTWWLLAAFVALAAASSVLSEYQKVVYLGRWFHYEGLVQFATYGALFFVAAQTANTKRMTEFVRYGAVAGLLLGVYGLAQAFGLDSANWLSMSWPGARAFSTWSNPDFFGGYLLFPLAFSAALVAADEDRRWKIVGGVSLLGISLALVMTMTRGAWLAGLLVAITLLVGLGRGGLGWKRTLLIAALVLAVAFGGAYAATDGKIVQRALNTFSSGDDGSGARVKIWRDTLPVAFARPVFGTGPDTFPLTMQKAYVGRPFGIPMDPHNIVLYLLVTLGVPATIAAAVLVIGVLVASSSLAFGASVKRSGIILGVWAATLGYSAYLMLNVSIAASIALLFVCLGVLSAAGARRVELSPAVVGTAGALAAALAVFAVVAGGIGLTADHAYLNARSAPRESEARIQWAERAVELNPLNDRYAQELETAKARK